MMRLALIAGFLGAMSVTIAAVLVLMSEAAPRPSGGERHGLLHINCPPGSHGKPRTFGVGADVLRAREAARTARQQ